MKRKATFFRIAKLAGNDDENCQDTFDAVGHNSAEPIGGESTMASNNGSNQINVPQAKNALNNMKYEIARELGVNLKQGYNGDLTSREAGYVGGYMVKRLVEQAEQQMASQGF